MAGYKKPRKYNSLEDRAIARKIWMKQITKQNKERAERYEKFQRCIDKHFNVQMNTNQSTNQFVVEPVGSSFAQCLVNKANGLVDVEVMRNLASDEETGVLVTLYADESFPSTVYDIYAKLNQQLVTPTITIVE